MDPLFLSHIIPDPSLCTLPMISLLDPCSFSQIFPIPQPHIFGSRCLDGWHGHTTTDAGPPHALSHWRSTNFSKRGNFKALWSSLVLNKIEVIKQDNITKLKVFFIINHWRPIELLIFLSSPTTLIHKYLSFTYHFL